MYVSRLFDTNGSENDKRPRKNDTVSMKELDEIDLGKYVF